MVFARLIDRGVLRSPSDEEEAAIGRLFATHDLASAFRAEVWNIHDRCRIVHEDAQDLTGLHSGNPLAQFQDGKRAEQSARIEVDHIRLEIHPSDRNRADGTVHRLVSPAVRDLGRNFG